MRAGPVLLYVIGIAIFCAMDAVMNLLVDRNPVLMATWWRYVVAIGFTFAIWAGSGRPAIRREMLPVHALRGAVIAASAFLFFWSLTRLTLAEAVTFSFIAPLLVPPLAAMFLKERMEGASLAAAALGFLGVLVAAGGDIAGLDTARIAGIAAVLGGAFTYALSLVMMRARAARDGAAIVSLLGAVFPMLVLAPFAWALVPASRMMPGAGDLGWLLLAGLFGALALQFIARAYARAEAQKLAPFEYTALGWAALFGWLFFSEPVGWRTWAGAGIIAAACLWQAGRAGREA